MKLGSGNWEQNVMHLKVQKFCQGQTHLREKQLDIVEMNLSNIVWPTVRTLVQQTCSTAHSIVTFSMKRETFISSIWRKIMDLKRSSHVQEKESCNQCEFTCETKGELEKHTSVEH